MIDPREINVMKELFGSCSDDELIAKKIEYPPHLPMHIAATQMLYERQQAKEKANHIELLAEIKHPHWSVTPSFYLLVLSVLLTAAALLVALTQRSQEQSPAAVAVPSKQTVPPSPAPASNSPPQSPSSTTSQSRPPKH